MTQIKLYGRPGCHLCEDAMRLLAALREEGFELEVVEINIETDRELHARFLERIPVIEADGRVISELVPSLDTLRGSLDTLGT
jgi:glutaredoxin